MIERIKNNRTLGVMLLGIVIWGILWQVGLAFTKEVLYHSVGLWIGIAVALFMGYNMAATLDDALDLGEGGATAHMRKFLLIRYAVACLAIAVLGFTRCADVVTCFAGILGLKVSAYLEPFLARLMYGPEENTLDEILEAEADMPDASNIDKDLVSNMNEIINEGGERINE